MVSIRARLVRFLLENRHRFRGNAPMVFARESSVLPFRDHVEQSARRFAKPPRHVTITPFAAPGVVAEMIAPVGGSAPGAILYFHGGGYVSGSVASHRNIVARLVKATGVKALSFEYGLAPERPFPAGLENALDAYAALVAGGENPKSIVLAGDSAGAGLALATLLAIRQRAEALPAAVAVLSPWVDLACSSPSSGMRDPLAPEGSWRCFAHHYCGENDPTNPLISPLYADLAGLPPLFIAVGTAEHMRDEVTEFAEKAKAAGVDVDFILGRDMVHCFPMLAPAFPEASKAFARFAGFIRDHAGSTAS